MVVVGSGSVRLPNNRVGEGLKHSVDNDRFSVADRAKLGSVMELIGVDVVEGNRDRCDGVDLAADPTRTREGAGTWISWTRKEVSIDLEGVAVDDLRGLVPVLDLGVAVLMLVLVLMTIPFPRPDAKSCCSDSTTLADVDGV